MKDTFISESGRGELKMKLLAAAVSALFLVQTAIAADHVYLCNGVYKNKPCGNEAGTEEHHLPPLTRYKARNYYIPPVSPKHSLPDSGDAKASVDPIKLNNSAEAVNETPETPSAETAGDQGNMKISGPEVDRFIAKSRGEEE